MEDQTTENTTLDLLPEEPHMSSAGNEGAVPLSTEPTLSLKELNEFLGKDFKDTATALKAVKDTFSYVGKRKEDIVKEVSSGTDNIASELKQLKENLFYKDNPDYAPYRALINKMGSNPEEVAQSPEFKAIFEKAKGFDDSQKLKTVLSSSPRLAASRDNISKARESQSPDEAARLATLAVLESLE